MNNDNYYDHDYTAGNDNTDHTPWDEHPDMKGILRAIENAGLMTEDISNLSRYSLQSQMKNLGIQVHQACLDQLDQQAQPAQPAQRAQLAQLARRAQLVLPGPTLLLS